MLRSLQCEGEEEEEEEAVSNSRLREGGCVVSSVMIRTVMFTELYSNDQIKENDMGGACSTYWTRKELHIGFGWGTEGETPL